MSKKQRNERDKKVEPKTETKDDHDYAPALPKNFNSGSSKEFIEILSSEDFMNHPLFIYVLPVDTPN